jgi:hypothetical protein
VVAYTSAFNKKTKEPPKRVNHKGNTQVPKSPLVARSISNKEGGDNEKG